MATERRGIACAGNWIIDHVYICDIWPQEEALANVLEEARGTGGSAYNCTIDLARFGRPRGGKAIPVEALGLTGRDADGEFIHENCRRLGIDASALAATDKAPTSYTLVIVAKATGRRTFFHNRGANALFAPANVPVDTLKARLFHLGYLLLLDKFDEPDARFGTKAARLLATLQKEGIETSIDVVSEDSRRFPRIVKPALRYADYAILNEFEAGRTTGHDLKPGGRPDPKAIRASTEALLALGVRKLVCVHLPEGAYVRTSDGRECWQPALQLPPGYIRSGVGAGDAFCSGMLYGLHEGWAVEDSLKLAVTAAAVCLADPTCTGAACSLGKTLKLAGKYPLQKSVF